jgi:DNA (cytosine-5)-methyltransferase 1
LAECGYDAEWENIPAAAVGAPHRRERVWLVAYPKRQGIQQYRVYPIVSKKMLYTRGVFWNGISRSREEKEKNLGASTERCVVQAPRWRIAVTGMDRISYGVPDRVDRIAACGNAVVPQIPELIGRAILAAEKHKGKNNYAQMASR